MNTDLEQKLWSAGQGEEPYTKETWYEIIDILLDDFQKFIGENFQREPEIYLSIEYPHSPLFSQWIWSEEKKISPLSTVWSAVIGGDMVGTEAGGNVKNIFYVSLTLFLFDATSKKRLSLKTGESVLEFVFEKQANGHGCWRSFGWCKDEWGEWEDVEY
ncbi:MAG TPA: hypothetical protein V6D28_27360 [Leptolyngbyaceae cyanobacterium]